MADMLRRDRQIHDVSPEVLILVEVPLADAEIGNVVWFSSALR